MKKVNLILIGLLVWASGFGQELETSLDSVADSIEPQSEMQFKLHDGCALLHIYRSASLVGAAVAYDVRLDGETVFRAKNKNKATIEVTREGLMMLSAKTETTTEVPIDIQFGREYYVRCKVKMGAIVGRPAIEIVDNATGKAEYDKITFKEKTEKAEKKEKKEKKN